MKTIGFALLGLASSIKVNRSPVYAGQFHWNEDPSSVPSPLVGKPYLTSTQARFIAENSTANIGSDEPKGPQNWHYNYGPLNENDQAYIQLNAESTVLTNSETGQTWRVTPDYGEKDTNIMSREADSKNGEKISGWTNPLAWTDDGADDNLVV